MTDLSSLIENKKELSEHLNDILVDSLFAKLQQLYETTRTATSARESTTALLKNFQTQLTNVPEWTKEQKHEFYESIVQSSGITYISDLIQGILTTQVKIIIKTENTNLDVPKMKFKVPSAENFIHMCLIVISRTIWKQTYLMYHNVRNLERQHNISQIEDIIRKAISTTIRSCLPLDQLFKYIQENTEQLQDDEEDDEVEEEATEEEATEEEEDEEATDAEEEDEESDEAEEEDEESDEAEEEDEEADAEESEIVVEAEEEDEESDEAEEEDEESDEADEEDEEADAEESEIVAEAEEEDEESDENEADEKAAGADEKADAEESEIVAEADKKADEEAEENEADEKAAGADEKADEEDEASTSEAHVENIITEEMITIVDEKNFTEEIELKIVEESKVMKTRNVVVKGTDSDETLAITLNYENENEEEHKPVVELIKIIEVQSLINKEIEAVSEIVKNDSELMSVEELEKELEKELEIIEENDKIPTEQESPTESQIHTQSLIKIKPKQLPLRIVPVNIRNEIIRQQKISKNMPPKKTDAFF